MAAGATSAVLAYCESCGRLLGSHSVWIGGRSFHLACAPVAAETFPGRTDRAGEKAPFPVRFMNPRTVTPC